MIVPARSVAVVLIAVAAACGTGRLLTAQRLYEPSLMREPGADPDVDRRPTWPTTKPKPMPTFGSNDRARWATVRALVENHEYVVGKRESIDAPPGYKDTGIIFDDGWQSIDRVLNPDTNEFLASKPPFLATLIAGFYWVIYHFGRALGLSGWTLSESPFAIVRGILFVVNIVPFVVYLSIFDRWVGRFAKSDWTRIVITAAAAFGTTVTPFLITLNNHTLAAFSVVFTLDGLFKIWLREAKRPTLAFAGTGFFAAFTVTNELPALAFAAAVFGQLLLCDVRRTLLIALPAALVIAAGYFGTNYRAVGQFRPVQTEFESSWYRFPGSHWNPPKDGEIKYGIDWARMHETRSEYALHMLVGHHGLFSLTPLWILAILGAIVGCVPRKPAPTETNRQPTHPLPWFVGPMTFALTVVVVGFYLFKSDNYGGWTNGLRWLMWLCPLWLLCLIPIVDAMASCKWRRGVVIALLAVSVMSAHYSPWNPWRHPWIYDLMQASGWKGYGR
jgi:hypothetical protein